jgi:hypothetical protein
MRKWEGERVVYARDVANSRVQDHQEVVVVGADVEALYPNLVDIEIANLCYQAIRAGSGSTTSTSRRPFYIWPLT